MNNEFTIEGVDCPSCVNKIESRINQINGVKYCNIEFVTKKLTIETEKDADMQQILKASEAAVRNVKPEIRLKPYRSSPSLPKERFRNKTELILLMLGALFYLLGLFLPLSPEIKFFVFLTALFFIGYKVLWNAIKNIFQGRIFDENLLMSLATTGAFAIGEYPEGVAVMLFYKIGELLEGFAVNRSRNSISALMDIRPDYANRKTGETIQKVSPEEIEINELIVVKPGEKVPLDGIVLEGNSFVDSSALTGESVPRSIHSGDTVLSGFINQSGVLTIKVTKKFGESAASRILNMVENAGAKKAPTVNFITKFASYYTPAIVAAALLLALLPPLFLKDTTHMQWIYRALVFLVISCPCALVISIPLGFFGGIGAASRQGILIKGGNYLEALNAVDCAVFDKTGTLTEGKFEVREISPITPFSQESLLEYAAYGEYYSNHPIAQSIQRAFQKEINKTRIANHLELSGYGIQATVDEHFVLLGNSKLLEEKGIPYSKVQKADGSVIYLAIDNQYAGRIRIADTIKGDAVETISGLRKQGINKIVMLTGDIQETASVIAGKLGIEEFFSELLPGQKVEQVERLKKGRKNNRKVLFVGDGMNDAPVLACADIGVTMGGLGSDAAIEAADIVIMTDEPSKLLTARAIAQKTKRIITENILFALGMKLLILGLGAVGIATMWGAVFADVGVTVLAVMNTMRLLQKKRNQNTASV